MGSFYTNVTVRTSNRDAVRSQLAATGRRAYISPPTGGAVVVFDEACEAQDPNESSQLASLLSQRCRCAALAVMIHDDDILWYTLYEDGAQTDEYTSAPDYFEGGDSPPDGGDAERLLGAFARPLAESKLDAILHRTRDAPDAYTFETERHADIVRALGLPLAAVGTGYHCIEAGEAPDELAIADLMRVG